MGRISKKIWLVIAVLLVALAAFYWYEIRPNQDAKACYQFAKGVVKDDEQSSKSIKYAEYLLNLSFESCLKSKGYK